jgi:hypothetical protein
MKRPQAALRPIFGPALLSTLALEHAHRKAISGIEHGPKQRGLLAATATRPNRIGFEAGKDFVFEFVIHEPITVRSGRTGKLKSEHSFLKDTPAPRFGMERFVIRGSKDSKSN